MHQNRRIIVANILAAALSLGTLAVAPMAAWAEDPSSGSVIVQMERSALATGGSNGANLVQSDNPVIVVSRIINGFLGLLGTIFVVLTIYAGFLWMTAGGNEEQVSKAKKLIKNAVIGLIIIMLSYSIAYFVISKLSRSTLGVDCGCPGCPC